MSAHTFNPNEVLEVRIGRDRKIEHYTAGHFRDDLLDHQAKVLADATMHPNAKAQAIYQRRFLAGIRDTWQKDTREDMNPSRRFKRYDFVRDSLQAPSQHQHLPSIGNFAGDKFVDEVTTLYTRGLLSRKFMDARHAPDMYEDGVAQEVFRDIQRTLSGASPQLCKRITDAAPTLFLFTELLKRTNILIEEEYTQLWARTIFPVRSLNTWLPQWFYNRIASRAPNFPQYVDADKTPSRSNRAREKRAVQTRNLVYYDEGASWTQHELWVAAEAVANGAPQMGIEQRRINEARRSLMHKENTLAFFGDPEVNILGLMSPEADTKIERIKAGTQFGSGTAEDDRQLLINTVFSVRAKTERIMQPNMVGLDSKSFDHIISRRYGSLDNPSNETVADAALDTLSKVGINSFTYIPELGPREDEEQRLKEKGVPPAEAKRLSGGGLFDIAPDGDPEDLQQVAAMLVARRSPDVLEMILAKDITMYPATSEVRGETEVRMIQGSGGVEFYKPEGVKLVTNVVGDKTLDPSATPTP